MKNRGTVEPGAVLRFLNADPCSVNELMQRAGLEKKYRQEVKAVLVLGVREGTVCRLDDGRFVRGGRVG